MAMMPKRKKSKDNPYTIIYCESNGKHFCIFKDAKNMLQQVEIPIAVFDALSNFELEDISQMHKFDKHIEHSEMFESTLNRRMVNPTISFEEIVEKKLLIENIKEKISLLPDTQKRRIQKYFFDNKTMEQIADEECCSKVAVKYSIDIAINKISKNLKF